METFDTSNDSVVTDIVEGGVASVDRAILYYAFGLSEVQSNNFFKNDRCFELNISSAMIDVRHFGLVDLFPRGTDFNVRYRALFLLDCIRHRFSQGNGRSAELALIRSGAGFDLMQDISPSICDALRNPLFGCPARDVLDKAGACEGKERDIQNCYDFHRTLARFYMQRKHIVSAMDGLRDLKDWFVHQESYGNENQPIIVTLMVRHCAVDSDPEIIITIEHTIVEVEKSVADEFARDFNCDSYVEIDECEDLKSAEMVEASLSTAVTLRVVSNDGNEDVEFELTSHTWHAVKDGFALCFPQYTVTTGIDMLHLGVHHALEEGDNAAVRAHIVNCVPDRAVFIHILSDGEEEEITPVVDQRVATHIFRRPQHRVANAMFEKVCQQLAKDGRSIDEYTSVEYVILVPKFNSLKQQTKERIEACAELVRGSEDSSTLVELYPLTATSISRMEALENKILNESNKEVLYVLIVDECHYAPSQNAIPILHRADIQGRTNFVALMVSATPYSCLSDKSRVPRDNIIEWSENVDKSERPNYIGFEHYFRSATYRLPCWELYLSVGDDSEMLLLPQFRELADFEMLAGVITTKLQDCDLLAGCTLRSTFNSSRFSFHFKRPFKGETVRIAGNAFLWSIGFSDDVVFHDTSASQKADNAPTVNNDISVASQHMREDRHFFGLYDAIVTVCPELERISTRVRLPALENGQTPVPKAEIRPGKLYPPLKHKLMAYKNGFTIIIDYIFSLAYYGSCRVVQPPDVSSTTFSLSPLPAEPEVTDDTCRRFLHMLDDSCYFDVDTDVPVSCDISQAVQAALNALCKVANEEIDGTEIDVIECVRHILKTKMKEEHDHHSTSESERWFTETDRIVRMLLTEREPAPMVLMRVFDKDENRSMQTILRHAMNACGLVHARIEKCDVPAFSVITDISETSLLREIEPFYRDEFNVGTAEAPMHVRDIIALRKKPKSDTDGNAKVPNLDLKYEDLLNVPCLIILCEKGRMGDTFPHTLRALDLRLRTGGTASCFLQEIGRMCRYPSTENGTVESVEDLDAFFVQNKAKFGLTVSIPSSNAFLGIAQNSGDVRRILDGLDPAWELSHVHLAHLVHPLPYALIDPKVMGAIRRAINKRETDISGDPLSFFAEQGAPRSRYAAEIRRLRRKIIQFLKMPRGVDDYLCCQTMKDPLTYKLLKSKGHYDFANVDPANQRHDRRFLLSAECQVGKTGAYLHLLTMLRHAIEKGGELLPAVPVAPAIPVGSLWCRWLIPSESNLRQQQPMQYDYPKTGKYHDCIAQQRIAQLKMLLADSHNAVPLHERFVECIKEYEQVVTSAGIARLWALSNIGDNDDVDYRHYINWDSRFIRDGRWHEMLREARSLQSLREEFVENQTIPLAQDVMFGLGTNAQIWDAVDADVDASTPPYANFGAVCKPVCADESAARAFNNIAKSVIAYQLSPRIVPLNDSVIVTLDNFFKNTTIGPRHRVGLQSPTHLITLSVPRAAFRLSPGPGCSFPFQCGPTLHAFLKQPQTIKNWVFTPSYCGTAVGPEEKLLLRDDAFCVDGKPLDRWIDYGEVLIVRANQLEMYQQFYGGTHIIAVLPESMQFVDSDGVVCPLMEAAKHGCGYSRRFSQLLAQYMGWDSIWMIDDYVLKCWKLVCKDLVCSKNNVTLEPATFAEVMLHIESMFFTNPAASTYPNLEDQVAKMIESEFDPRMATSSRMRGLADVTGVMQDKYGVIGMCRGRQWRSNIAHPIKRSYSVYSFFLLNVKATAGNGLYFPARPIWEDIEFNNLLDENNLLVCKLQVFAHEKLSHAAAMLTPLEPEPVADHEKLLNWLEEDGFLLSTERKEMLMPLPQKDSVLVALDNCVQQPPQQACFISLVHNPTVFQTGAFSSIARSTCTLQTCVDCVLSESTILELAMASVAGGDVGAATWLMIFPLTDAITELDAPLRADYVSHLDLHVSYVRLLPPRAAVGDICDAYAIMCATIQRLSAYEEDLSIDPIVHKAEVMEIDTREDPAEPSAPVSSTDARDSVSAKRKRASTASSSPRKRNSITLTPQEQYMFANGPALVQEYDRLVAEQGLTAKQGQKLRIVREGVYAQHVLKLNDLEPKKVFTAVTMHNRCRDQLSQRRGQSQRQDFPEGTTEKQRELTTDTGSLCGDSNANGELSIGSFSPRAVDNFEQKTLPQDPASADELKMSVEVDAAEDYVVLSRANALGKDEEM